MIIAIPCILLLTPHNIFELFVLRVKSKKAHNELEDVLGVKSKIHRNVIIRCPKTSNTSIDQKNTTREARRGEERRVGERLGEDEFS